jgi:myxalamid-type nonribosomal peptide synthetase MxaA
MSQLRAPSSSPRPLLREEERHQILVEWNEPPEYPRGGLITDLVAEQVARRPDAVAVVSGEQVVRYAELEARAESLAGSLRRFGVGPEVVVGVLLERSPDMIATILAIWKCGGAYLPLDPELPAERMGWLLQDGLRGSGPRLVLTQRDLAACIPAAAMVELAFVEDLGVPAGEGDAADRRSLLPENPAYVIYTSGSTGRPKGIVISHRSLANRISWACGTELGPADAYLQKTTLTFDISLSEIWTPLAAGGRCVLVRPGGQRDPAYLASLIHQERITHASFPPPLLRLLLEVPGSSEKLRSLRVLITGGETVPPDLPQLALRLLPATNVYNRYGPTETTISCMSGACKPEGHGETVPIGRGTARTQVYVLDEELQPVPPMVPGEIYLGGPGVARGYLGRPDLTAEKFLPDPFGGDAGGRLYRTGDRAQWRPEGAVDFLGRVDYQVKVRGYRIEIEEVELALLEHPRVREAAVVPLEEAATGSSRLVACVVSIDGTALDFGELRRFLGDRLASYMIPASFVPLEEMPHTLSGKIDRAALRALVSRDREAEPPPAAPRSDLEATLTGFFEELLEVSGIGPDESLLERGVHSLLVVRLQTRLRNELGIELELADVTRNPSVGALARFIAAGVPGVGITARQLEKEAELPVEIQPSAGGKAADAPARAVLLTGATGFLGAYLLDQLLAQTRAQVFCLVRAADEAAAARSLRRAMERYGLWREDRAERIVAVTGDLALPFLGLGESSFHELAATVDAVYHCGAQVNLLYPYEALRATNVGGTLEVLRFAIEGRTKTVHHVSTLSVLERLTPPPGAAPEAPLDEDGAQIEGGYRQSKWVAERLVEAARRRGVPVVIYRPGWITGDSTTGMGSPTDFLVRLVVASLRLGVAPDLGAAELCPTPVDYVSAALVWLSRQRQPADAAEPADPVYHLINPQAVAFDRMIELVRELGYPVRKIPLRRWAADLEEFAAGSKDQFLAPLGSFLEQPKSDSPTAGQPEAPWVPWRFETARTRAALAAGPVSCPSVDRRLLALYLAALAREGLIPHPEGGQETSARGQGKAGTAERAEEAVKTR